MTQPKTLAAWLSYLETLHPSAIALGLERVDAVRRRMQLSTPFIVVIVGGTNGKGSTCAMMEAILHAAGYRVGCYISPHLLRYNERVRIGCEETSDAELCAAFTRIEAARKDTPLTYFEMGTLAAVDTFARAKVDVAILEIGLGGRLDAVNIFDPDCAVLTSVDIDHTDYLGKTRDQIGFEKAHIFRTGKPAVCALSDPPQSVLTHADKIGAELLLSGRDFDVAAHASHWDFSFRERRRHGLPFPALRGAYQVRNAAAALVALETLVARLPVSRQDVRNGLTRVRLLGRFQTLPGRPVTILDVAHNREAAATLATNLGALPPARTHAVFAMLKDKEISAVIEAVAQQIDAWYVADLPGPRGASSSELQALLPAGSAAAHASVQQAWQHACNKAAENDRIVVFGSFLTVAGVMAAMGQR